MKRTLFVLAWISLLAPVVHAQVHGVPTVANCTVPNFRLVGTNTSGVPDPLGAFTITVRDGFNDVLANRSVRVDFSACTDIGLSSTQPSGSVDCVGKVVTLTTDVNGVASGVILGHVTDFTLTSGARCVKVYAENLNGQLPAWVDITGALNKIAAVFDLDGANGVNTSDPHDYLNWFCDFASGAPHGRSDYNFNGSVNGDDFALLLQATEAKGSAVTSPRCDNQPAQILPIAATQSGFDIRWGRCGQSYNPVKTFTCDVDDQGELGFTFIAPPGITQVRGFEVDLEISSSPGTTLPEYWQYDSQNNGCATVNGGLTCQSYFTTGPQCPQRVGVIYGPIVFATYPAGAPNVEHVRIMSQIPTPITMVTGRTYGLCRLIVPLLSGSPDACGGCQEGVEIKVTNMLLSPVGCSSTPHASDVQISNPDYAGSVYWQFPPTGGLAVSTGTPSTVGQGTVDLRITGAQIAAGASVVLHQSGQSDIAGTVLSVSADGYVMNARFNLTTAALGNWDIVVTNPGPVSATSAVPIKVVTLVPGHLTASIVGMSRQRPSRQITEDVVIKNSGNVAFDGTGFVAVYVPTGTGTVSVSRGSTSLGNFTPLYFGVHDLVGVFTVPNPATSEALSFTFTTPATLGTVQMQLELFQVPRSLPGPPVEPLALGATTAELVRSGAVLQGSGWPALSPAFLSALKTQLDGEVESRMQSYWTSPTPNLSEKTYGQLVEDCVEAALTALNGTYGSDVAAYRTTWDPFRQVPGNNNYKNFIGYIASVMATPPRPTSGYPDPTMIKNIDIVASVDPNDKSGPSGPGSGHYIDGTTALDYLIHFENQATATAAAQTITVDDVLDPAKFDLSTLSIGRITFNDKVVDPPPGLQDYTTDVDLRPGVNVIARVSASLSTLTGALNWRLTSLDPATMQPTQDPDAGLLPPNVTQPQGEGTVSFSVARLSSLTDGAVLSNQARIVFDENPYIDTPVWTNTLDLTPPASQVASLTPTQDNTTFNVGWSGSDAASGIADYSVYVSDNGGAYSAWQTNTTSTTAPFTGTPNHTYAFYSVARDNVGHVEAAPGSPDAATALVTGVDASDIPSHLAMRFTRRPRAHEPLHLDLALPRATPVQVSILDVAGRLVASRSVTASPGHVDVELDGFAEAHSGVFFARAIQGSETVTFKFVALR